MNFISWSDSLTVLSNCYVFKVMLRKSGHFLLNLIVIPFQVGKKKQYVHTFKHSQWQLAVMNSATTSRLMFCNFKDYVNTNKHFQLN